MEILDQAEAFEERRDVLLHGKIEVNRGSVPQVRIPTFQPGIQVQYSSFAVFHADAQQRVLKIVERLRNELELPIRF